MWRIPKIRGTLLGVPILRIIVYWGLYWGTPIFGNYHVCFSVYDLRKSCELEGRVTFHFMVLGTYYNGESNGKENGT